MIDKLVEDLKYTLDKIENTEKIIIHSKKKGWERKIVRLFHIRNNLFIKISKAAKSVFGSGTA